MKWVGLLIILSAIVPFSGWLRRNPAQSPKAWMLIGFLPFVMVDLHLNMAVLSWPDWSGHVKGIEFSVLDGLALSLYLSLSRTQHALPFKFSMLLYFLATVLSVFQAQVPIAALFYVWQLARMFLIYTVTTRGCADERVVAAILTGMAAGLFLEAAVATWERFALGMVQAGGTMIHQNLLGLVSHLIIFPFFALLLAGRRGWWPPAVLVAGVIVEVLTTSRATVGLAGLGYSIVFIISAMRRWTSRKGTVLMMGLAAVAVLSPLALSSFEHRFGATGDQIGWLSDQDEDYDERAAFIRAATMMLSDHPLGVGANHYTLAAITDGYNQRAGVVYTSYFAVVHNIYWLIAAETGYLGVISFVLLLLRPLTVAFVCAWRYRKDQRADLMLGLGVAILVVYLHSFYEWIFITFQAQYLFAVDIGLVAGLAQQLGYWRRSYQGVHLEVSARPSV